ncbi:MAG: hypothetical protein R2772_07495 [Chitinophagales bacterium]
MEIKLMKREEIDDKRWNGCVHFALSATPYAYTWYLDNVCETWDALVVGEYKMVMPIVYAKKFGFTYCYQPFFTQQLGVYADIPLSKETIDAFFSKIPEHIQYLDCNLNESNYAPSLGESEERENFLLDLKPAYEDLKKKFSGNVLKNLKRAEKAELFVSNHLSPELFADFYLEHTAKKIPGFKKKHYYMMLRIIYHALHYKMGVLLGVYNQKQELLAVNFLIDHPQRLINLMPSSSEEGLKHGAMAFLMNNLMERNAGQNKYLDFEGSMIEGVANFYKGFGAKRVIYYRVKLNHLPKILRIFKK